MSIESLPASAVDGELRNSFTLIIGLSEAFPTSLGVHAGVFQGQPVLDGIWVAYIHFPTLTTGLFNHQDLDFVFICMECSLVSIYILVYFSILSFKEVY